MFDGFFKPLFDTKKPLIGWGLGCTLYDENEKNIAKVIGRAMRLGASLAAGNADVLHKASLHRSAKCLELRLDSSVANYGGETVEMRLCELAACLGCKGTVTVQ